MLTVNGKALSDLTLEADGLRYEKTENGIASFKAVAGSFTFTISSPVSQQAEKTAGNGWLLPALLAAVMALSLPVTLLFKKRDKNK